MTPLKAAAVPAERHIQVVEDAVAGHVGLAGAAFLARAAVVADGAAEAVVLRGTP